MIYLYHHIDSAKNIVYTIKYDTFMDRGDIIYLNITNNSPKIGEYKCNSLNIDKNYVTTSNVDDALKFLHETGESWLQINGSAFIHMVGSTFTPVYQCHFDNPEWNERMKSKPQHIPISLDFIRTLYQLAS